MDEWQRVAQASDTSAGPGRRIRPHVNVEASQHHDIQHSQACVDWCGRLGGSFALAWHTVPGSCQMEMMCGVARGAYAALEPTWPRAHHECCNQIQTNSMTIRDLPIA